MAAMSKTLLMRCPSARQIHAARVALDWNQQELADAAGVGIATIKRLEFNHRDADLLSVNRHETLRRIVAALEQQGIEFIFSEGREGVIFATAPRETVSAKGTET